MRTPEKAVLVRAQRRGRPQVSGNLRGEGTGWQRCFFPPSLFLRRERDCSFRAGDGCWVSPCSRRTSRRGSSAERGCWGCAARPRSPLALPGASTAAGPSRPSRHGQRSGHPAPSRPRGCNGLPAAQPGTARGSGARSELPRPAPTPAGAPAAPAQRGGEGGKRGAYSSQELDLVLALAPLGHGCPRLSSCRALLPVPGRAAVSPRGLAAAGGSRPRRTGPGQV